MRLEFFITRIVVVVAFGRLIWALVALKRGGRIEIPTGHQEQAEPDMLTRIAITTAIALVGSTGVYLTTVEPESDPTIVSGTITAAAANRAGAVVSVTPVDFGSADRLIQLPPALPLKDGVQVASFFVY
jgi:uncharacterized membrane protein (DUF441 family)